MAAFLGRYVGEYLRLRLGGLPHHEAYAAISFERDAESAAGAAVALGEPVALEEPREPRV
jgi:hypothetical protein